MLRKAKEQDISECAAIEYEAFGEDKKIIKHDLTKQAKDDDYLFFVIEIKGKVAGFITAKIHKWNKSIYVERLYVHKDERNKGYGSKLLAKIISIAKKLKMRKLFVDTGEKNKRAVRFYLKNGFIKTGYIKDFYNDPHDRNCIVFCYNL
ncbi:MAG: hypothetical protein DRP13_01605 [Candidatus Aenigmatarchaeota archaeon]|nr:MAG: hypothetical protein DRP16_00875 [Candidatus Aenigmarchaeota archaeon]RLJ09011.1 MAG: hypothetical protein DRP13_01605 [Candidatus Aenigmarchaeota archaeon]